MSKLNVSENTQPNIRKRRLGYLIAVTVVAVVLAVVLVVGSAFSWFAPPSFNKSDSTVRATDFSAQMLISFDGEEYNVLNNNSLDKIIVVGDTSDNKANLANVSLKVRYNGDSSAYVKVQLFDSWFKGSELSSAAVIAKANLSYTLDTEYWKYDAENECFVTLKPISAYIETEEESSTFDIPFVTSITCNDSYTDAYVYFNLVSVIESVQPDRYDEFFGTAEDTSELQ